MIDKKILKYLWRKHDGKYYDVSEIFNVYNPYNYYNRIDNFEGSPIIIPELKKKSYYTKLKNLFRQSINKDDIDDCVISLEENVYVDKQVEGRVSPSQIAPGDDNSFANNSICRITAKGIEYYENYMHNFRNRRFYFVSLIISILALLFTFTKIKGFLWMILQNIIK